MAPINLFIVAIWRYSSSRDCPGAMQQSFPASANPVSLATPKRDAQAIAF
jgi:hypothetical protein